MQKYIGPVLIAVVVLIIIFGGALVGLYTDWLWFNDLGYGTVFSTLIWSKIKLGLLAGVLFFAIIYGNLWYARRIAPPPSPMGLEQQLIERLGRLARRGIGIVIFAASIILSAMVGLEAATHWEEWLKYFNATPFGIKDPVFSNDIGFYVFKLPFLSYVYHWLFFALAASAIAAIALHYADEAIDVFGNRVQFAPKVKAHVGILIAAMFFLKAWGYRLSMYDVLFSKGTLFDGAGYTDIHARIPALWILLVIAIIGGLLVLINITRRGVGYAAVGLIGLIGASILIGGIYPAAVEQFSVAPNEFDKERPYIKRAIEATQNAYALGEIAVRPYSAEPSLTAGQIEANTATIENIRLWDQNHLQPVYNQNDTIRQFYHFQELDVDRYRFTGIQGGEPSYRQVWLSAREIDQAQLPERSKTWINQHLQYTHGYGFVMSPVNEVGTEGLPQYFVRGLPPKPTVDLPLKRMGVYFGELTDNYVFVKTSSKEFDSSGRSKTYKGDGGVRVGGFFRKLMLAARFSDINILLNSNIKSNSRILYIRNINERVEKLLPFLEFDSDPYLVVVNGDMYWMRDGYTSTNAYPYSRNTQPWGGDTNYVRNSVKVVVNAYTGDVDAYITEKPLRDPIIRTYQKIFKGIFKPISEMPAGLQEHVRYPEDMFRIQTSIYSRYHYNTNELQAFYSNNDLWEIPNRADLTGANGEQPDDMMEPYYVIMKLPNGKGEEFILMTPYVRAGGRKNMVAWLCAKCDPQDYGKLVLYQFPEDKSVYGPQQVVGRASQDTAISQQLSLWNQQGSSVGSGNLLVIPIDSSFLYVMPVYLVSTSTKIPELKRVIVALGDRIAMEPTLNEALASVVGQAITPTPAMGKPAAPRKAGAAPTPVPAAKAGGEINQLINQAASQINKAEQAQRNGDWAAYGEQIKALKQTLKELQSRSK